MGEGQSKSYHLRHTKQLYLNTFQRLFTFRNDFRSFYICAAVNKSKVWFPTLFFRSFRKKVSKWVVEKKISFSDQLKIRLLYCQAICRLVIVADEIPEQRNSDHREKKSIIEKKPNSNLGSNQHICSFFCSENILSRVKLTFLLPKAHKLSPYLPRCFYFFDLFLHRQRR